MTLTPEHRPNLPQKRSVKSWRSILESIAFAHALTLPPAPSIRTPTWRNAFAGVLCRRLPDKHYLTHFMSTDATGTFLGNLTITLFLQKNIPTRILIEKFGLRQRLLEGYRSFQNVRCIHFVFKTTRMFLKINISFSNFLKPWVRSCTNGVLMSHMFVFWYIMKYYLFFKQWLMLFKNMCRHIVQYNVTF